MRWYEVQFRRRLLGSECIGAVRKSTRSGSHQLEERRVALLDSMLFLSLGHGLAGPHSLVQIVILLFVPELLFVDLP